MALTRTKYGVEFDPRLEERDGSSGGIGWIVVLVVVAAAVSFVVTVVRRISASAAADEASPPALVVGALAPSPSVAAPTASAEPRAAVRAPAQTNAVAAPPAVPEPDREVRSLVVSDFGSRPARAKNLLLRLDEAARKGDVAMQVATIEQIRALPGEPVADIDDSLVERLGELNMRWLLELRNPQWVAEVVVKRGDSATRIAKERGSTLGSLKLLNPGLNVDMLKAGARVKVMDRPAFSLVVHKRLRAVDLNLNGKLFKRYSLPDDAPEIPWEPGTYTTPANLREFFNKQGVSLTLDDLSELDTFVPRDTPVRVSPS